MARKFPTLNKISAVSQLCTSFLLCSALSPDRYLAGDESGSMEVKLERIYRSLTDPDNEASPGTPVPLTSSVNSTFLALCRFHPRKKSRVTNTAKPLFPSLWLMKQFSNTRLISVSNLLGSHLSRMSLVCCPFSHGLPYSPL